MSRCKLGNTEARGPRSQPVSASCSFTVIQWLHEEFPGSSDSKNKNKKTPSVQETQV